VIAWVGGKGQDGDLFDFCDFVIALVGKRGRTGICLICGIL
jgi:hypothetical protein